MTQELMCLPRVGELECLPDGFYRKEWDHRGNHWYVVGVSTGDIKRQTVFTTAKGYVDNGIEQVFYRSKTCYIHMTSYPHSYSSCPYCDAAAAVMTQAPALIDRSVYFACLSWPATSF